MKLRLRGSSIRLRLTRTEVERLACGERVEETLAVGGARLLYAVETVEGDDPPAARLALPHGQAELTVLLSHQQVEGWAAGEEVGIYSEATGGPDERLTLAVEKDFRCLTPRSALEDPADAYPHPREENATC